MMKTAYKLYSMLLISLISFSCEGPEGMPGLDGVNVLGKTFEFQTSFTQNNSFSFLYTFPTNVTIYESDAVLVYLLEETLSGANGNTDVWTPLPQSFFVNQGLLQYTFNHTYSDVNVMLQSNFDLNNLSNIFTENKVFRVVVMPAEFAQSPEINLNNLSSLMNSLGLQEADVIKN